MEKANIQINNMYMNICGGMSHTKMALPQSVNLGKLMVAMAM